LRICSESEEAPVDVTGPVGIVYLTKQMSDLGIAYLLQFAALLSINLAIINILPIPALDGGRILFVLIEKLKGSPVSRRTEGLIHQIGFILLLLLMVIITVRDFSTFRILKKIGQLFS
jgi:regulator of sigma E protease